MNSMADGNSAALAVYMNEQDREDEIAREVDEGIAYDARLYAKDALKDPSGTVQLVDLVQSHAEDSADYAPYRDTLQAVLTTIRQVPFTLSHLTPGEQMQALREQVETVLYRAAHDAIEYTERDKRLEEAV